MKDPKLGKKASRDNPPKDSTPLSESEERLARVAELRRKYLRGEYRVDAEAVAAAIVNEEIIHRRR